MSKKILSLTLILILSSHSLLAAAGTYIGISGGFKKSSWKITDAAGNRINFGDRGKLGSLFAGYGDMVSSWFYLGSEASVDFASTPSPNKIVETTLGPVTGSMKETSGYSMGVIPGVVISQSLVLYGRVSVGRANFTVRSDNAAFKKSLTLTGKQIGLGIQHNLSANTDIRIEYAYIKYKELNVFEVNTTPCDRQLTLGLAYRMY